MRPSQLRDLNVRTAVLSFLVAKGFNDMETPQEPLFPIADRSRFWHAALVPTTDGYLPEGAVVDHRGQLLRALTATRHRLHPETAG
ncbi:hypothetical protein [Streptomyces gibsoniae]|uniref:Uncharacterized protein n=1 Tax=Streptomyces gibsoniae TaxID=3075529 RepID=A0ABU2U7N0_9ACTN|nr:hypothetical protein [Streptomyces sp. DSM 41699]MDT0469236.1 hypothetical protein [Streptomyces sp. DSM 41699]